MKVYRRQFIVLVFAVLLVLPSALRAQVPKAHRHLGNMESMVAEIATDFSMVETTLEKGAVRDNVVKNKSRTFEAFTVDLTQIFVKDLKTGKIYEIKGLPAEWRFFADLTWATNQILMFDRWVQPRYATHYAVNVVRKKLLDATPFPDEFMLKQKSGKR
jgi:hypothetical protein